MIPTTLSPSSSSLLSIKMGTILFLLFTAVVSVVMIVVPWLPFQQQHQQYASVYVSSFQLLSLQRHQSPFYHHHGNNNGNNQQQLSHHSRIVLLAVDATSNKALIDNTNEYNDDDDDIIATVSVSVSVPVTNNKKYTQQWEENFTLLKQYYQREGHYNIPSLHKEDGKKLGYWVVNQRRLKRNGKLLTERKKKLNDLEGCNGDEFFGYTNKQIWEDNFSALVRYKQREGHCSVPLTYQEDKKQPKLGRWLQNQRSNKSTGKLDGMREQRLLDLGVVLDNIFSNRWDDNFALLCEYKQTEGHCNVPRWYKGGDGMEGGTKKINLGRWINTQKTMKNENKLDSAKQQKLDDIGFMWAVPRNIFGDDYFLLLEEYKSREGHCIVPIDHKEDSINLGMWLVKQRRNEREQKLDSTRKEKLNQLGVKWQVSHAQSWEELYNLLEQYQKREGTCTIKLKHKEDGKNLGKWLYSQRRMKLDSSRRKRLYQLGVNSVVSHAQSWEDMYTLLVQYKEREGNCDVKTKHKENGRNLGTWTQYQRQKYRIGTLSLEYLHKLEDIGVVFWE